MPRSASNGATLAAVLAVVLAIPALGQAPAAGDGTVLLDPGAEPRRELRYAWTEGYRERTTATIDMAIAASEGGVPVLTMRLPMTMTMLAGVTATGDDGSARIAVLLEDVGFGPLEGSGSGLAEGEPLPPEATEGFEAAAELLSGLRSWQVMDDRGGVLRTGTDLPAGVPPEFEQQLAQASGSIALLPDEPVGVGARWETTGTTVSQGITVGLTTEVELVARDGDDVTLRMTMRRADGADVMSLTQNPFETFTIDGVAVTSVDLGGIFPSDTSMDLVMTLAGDIPTEGGVVEPVEMDVTIAMKLASEPT